MIKIWGQLIVTIPIVYSAAVIPAKLAVLHLYLHIFTDKRMRFVCYLAVAVLLGNWLACTIGLALVCRPISYFWTGEGKCVNVNAFFRWSGVPNILTDCIILVLPLPMVYNLQTSLRLKKGIALTFLLGSIGLVASIIRFYEFFVTNAEIDGTWSATPFVIWCIAEAGTYQVAACLPLYRPLFKFLGGRTRPTQLGNSSCISKDTTLHSLQDLNEGKPAGRFHSLKGNNVSIDEDDGRVLVSPGDQQFRSDHDANRVESEYRVTYIYRCTQ